MLLSAMPDHCKVAIRIHVLLQLVVFGLAYWQLRTNASPGDRLQLLPAFFFGAAEIASGVTGL